MFMILNCNNNLVRKSVLSSVHRFNLAGGLITLVERRSVVSLVTGPGVVAGLPSLRWFCHSILTEVFESSDQRRVRVLNTSPPSPILPLHPDQLRRNCTVWCLCFPGNKLWNPGMQRTLTSASLTCSLHLNSIRAFRLSMGWMYPLSSTGGLETPIRRPLHQIDMTMKLQW